MSQENLDFHQEMNVPDMAAACAVLGAARTDTATHAAYGGMWLQTPGDPGWDIGAGWETLFYDALAIASPRGVSFDLANETFTIVDPGVYVIDVNGSFEHDSSNQGRSTLIRTFNVTDGVAGNTVAAIGIGRNVEVTNYGLSVLFEVGAAEVGDAIRLEIGGNDSITVENWLTNRLTIFSVGELRT